MNIIIQNVEDKYIDEIRLVNFSIRDLAIHGYSEFPIKELCLNDQDAGIYLDAIKYINLEGGDM